MTRSVRRRSASLMLFFGAAMASCAAQQVVFPTNPTQFLVCNKGEGSFHGRMPDFSARSGVTVDVGASHREGFADRACQVSLHWKGGTTLVGSDLQQADIDVLGADLGFGMPVVAFQIKATASDPTIRYEIYSLKKPARLLRTLVGESYFSAADTRLDGSVEIWTTDAGAIRGFDGLPRRAFDTAPVMVLRFEHGSLMDVSSEYPYYFDHQIQALRAEITPQEANAFKASDGRLNGERKDGDGPTAHLLATKVRVLEIVWAYLYSGRATEAWTTLDEMWPASDVDRVRSAIITARKHGLAAQVDGVSDRTEPVGKLDSAYLFSEISRFGDSQRGGLADSAPRQILLRLPSPKNPTAWNSEERIEVVIDAAGKVRSARMADGWLQDISTDMHKPQVPDLLQDAAGWRYIPAYKDGHPQAFRATLAVLRDR